jgi:hypothetical protein
MDLGVDLTAAQAAGALNSGAEHPNRDLNSPYFKKQQ